MFLSISPASSLKRGEFESRDDLIDKVMGFIADHDHAAKPFRWTCDANPLKAA